MNSLNQSQRLQKYMAGCGIASRRKCEDLIRQGLVTVNGHVAELGSSVVAGVDQVQVNGTPVQQEEMVYVLLNKPRNVVTTVEDTHDRLTVIDCLEEGVRNRVFPIGRLDMDVEGVLILTNDGELANRIMHPKYAIEKVYLALVKGQMDQATAARMAKGVKLDDGMTAPAKVDILNVELDRTRIRLVLHEGKKREVKRLCHAVGHRVLQLKRLAVAGLQAGELRTGEWRYLTPHEVSILRARVGLSNG